MITTVTEAMIATTAGAVKSRDLEIRFTAKLLSFSYGGGALGTGDRHCSSDTQGRTFHRTPRKFWFGMVNSFIWPKI